MSFFVEFYVSFFIALIVTNFMEWATHKWVLHGLGKRKNSWFKYHWQHHAISRKNNFQDPDYKLGFFNSWAIRREVFGLAAMLLFNINWLFIWPMLFYWFCFFTILYYVVHKYSHNNPEMAKKYLRWHYDHHQGLQNANWCVTLPLFDYILGTRVKSEEKNRTER